MSATTALGLTITNPLVKYRALLATKSIAPDNGQLRLALHLQKLYERLKDYEPQVEYSRRLEQISRAVESQDERLSSSSSSANEEAASQPQQRQSTWRSFLAAKERRDSLALTRTLTSHESAMQLSSPQGLMVHGEVGTGKSMLIDLFAESLPTRKKRRWHFNTFMLETIAKLEAFRQERSRPRSFSGQGSLTASHASQAGNSALQGSQEDDYSLLWLARDMIQTSPILFLDEFQMPDRVASKILTNLMTSFFQLGGVLIATSNRMPEELAKASGIEFTPPPSRMEALGWQFGLRRRSSGSGNSGLYYGQNEFVAFLEVLKARCEVWEMEGGTDYRRVESGRSKAPKRTKQQTDEWRVDGHDDLQHEQGMAGWPESAAAGAENEEVAEEVALVTPTYFYLTRSEDSPQRSKAYEAVLQEVLAPSTTESVAFAPDVMHVYGRAVPVPRAHDGITEWTFAELCKSTLGPADYITLASTYHTLILRDVPVLSWLMKNEARRFITLLDALYECRCKLYIHNAAAGPDDLFFPEQTKSAEEEGSDAVYSETFSEVYQDATAPFRPNILTENPNYSEPEPEPDYTHARLAGLLNADALEDDPPNRPASKSNRNPFGRSFGRSDAEMERPPIDPDDSRYTASTSTPTSGSTSGSRGMGGSRRGPDFSKTSAFTGEDEMFAYRRAQSRLWELCGAKWWARDEEGWHRPLPREVRRWEGRRAALPDAAAELSPLSEQQRQQQDDEAIPLGRRPVKSDGTSDVRIGDSVVDDSRHERMFRHGGSPFRVEEEPPPKFGWAHAWGMMRWGKKAGAWGQGVEGLKDRRK